MVGAERAEGDGSGQSVGCFGNVSRYHTGSSADSRPWELMQEAAGLSGSSSKTLGVRAVGWKRSGSECALQTETTACSLKAHFLIYCGTRNAPIYAEISMMTVHLSVG